jgi:YcxB-like protein
LERVLDISVRCVHHFADIPALHYSPKSLLSKPRLYGLRTVTFDDDGLKSDSEIAHVEIKWNSFEKFRETKNLFLTYQTRDVVGIVPKRAFPSQEAIAQFRNLLASKIRQN